MFGEAFLPERKQHKNKHIESALKHAESEGWTLSRTQADLRNLGLQSSARTTRRPAATAFGVDSVYGAPRAIRRTSRKKIRKAVEKCEEQEGESEASRPEGEIVATYEFVLKFTVGDAEADPSQYFGALGDAGCTDALVGVGQMGVIALDFSREAPSARAAITSAIAM